MRPNHPPSIRECIVTFAVMFALLALALSENPHEAHSPDFSVASR